MSTESSSTDPEIDWGVLAERLDAGDSGSTRLAQLALAEVIGPDRIRATVDWYVAGRPGSELARSALWQLKPPAARDRCVELWRNSDQSGVRRLAIELLRAVATSEDVDLVPEFLADTDPEVQAWGIGVLDQVIWSDLVEPEDVEPILEGAERHPNSDVRERAQFIRDYVTARESPD